MNFLFRKRTREEKAPVPIPENYYQKAFNHISSGLIVYTRETLEIVEVNAAAKRLFGLPADADLKGLYISQLMMRHLSGSSPNMEKLLNEVNQDWSGEALFMTPDKKTFHGLVDTNILQADPANAFRMMSITDISTLAHFRAEAKAAQTRMEIAADSKARFLSSMSHELRTPLNGIIGASELVLSSGRIEEPVRNHLSVIKYSSEHMLGIVNDILDFSKIDAQKMELKLKAIHVVTWLEKIRSVFQSQFLEQDIALLFDYDDGLLHDLEILCDETKLSQVLKNLLSNALKFTNHGSVSLIVKPEQLSDTSVRLYFELRDTGIGIPREKQGEVFTAFVQVYSEALKRQYDGSGLGLTISSQLIDLMGGTLQLESEPDVGSRFFFSLTFDRPPGTTNIREIESEAVKDIRGVRALIVEDNEINAGILRSFLTRWKMPVKEAITGLHALELIRHHKFDVILMDLEMPEMNGHTTLRKIRELNIDVPVIAFTATLLEDMSDLITESGFTDYISKPFKPAELRKKIEKYCERKVDYA